jgi:hypothetical protein
VPENGYPDEPKSLCRDFLIHGAQSALQRLFPQLWEKVPSDSTNCFKGPYGRQVSQQIQLLPRECRYSR